ncbi:MAG: enoyl-CoA hydratase/isomerase family protein [Alphaproteobacteria bacterium]|nr:enoyl-CoA hydratase/isomerase family protein [Alphaproteobacteria bacterium]
MTEPDSDHRVRFRVDGAVGIITLDRPNKLKALYPEMILRLVDLIEQVRRDNAIRALVVRGEGRAFCSGDDLSPEDRFKYGPPDLQTRLRTGFPRAVLDMLTLRKPIVGIVQGYAVGAGLDVALACDFRFSDPKCKFGAVYVNRGLGGGSTYLLPRFVGLGRATELLLLGRFVEMEEALRLGLVTEVVPMEQLEKKAMEFAHKLAKGPTQAYGAIKNARNQGLGLDPVKGFEAQILANVELMFHKDAREGPRAFRQGREPNFTSEWIDLQYDPLVPYE